MATRTRTINSFQNQSLAEQQRHGQSSVSQTAFSSHLDTFASDPQYLLAPVRPPTGASYLPTSQAQETIHRPTYTGPSTATRVVLGGAAAGIQAGASAYVQIATLREHWRGFERTVTGENSSTRPIKRSNTSTAAHSTAPVAPNWTGTPSSSNADANATDIPTAVASSDTSASDNVVGQSNSLVLGPMRIMSMVVNQWLISTGTTPRKVCKLQFV
ncbi:hypothetical protein P171DRAFT_492347 [Karstenula rhodostoma CBS 690.94]|uniref:Uncharacterized protein n=1 Tax=Karstenula rhodostoma CBS 690.94 TaxID=1392251 RepID=A0A9P4P4T0_9PLEO|nr:hypothetical protein P171DRAFT_492347 [Karstenula rhodostoma CBS 690.94]